MRWFLDAAGGPARQGADLARLLPFAAAYALLHGLLVGTGLLLSSDREVAVPIWPAVGLLCAVLVATPRKTWLLWIACAIVGRILFDVVIIDNRSLLAPMLFSVVNVVEALIFALLMQPPLVQSYNQGRPLYLATAMTLVAILAVSIGGVMGAVALHYFEFTSLSFVETWRVWAAGDFVGIILVTPLAVWLMLPQIRIRRDLSRWPETLAMFAALALLLAATTYLAPQFSPAYSGISSVGLAALLAVPVLWAAMRAEYPVVAILQLVLAIALIVSASYGLGPFAHDLESYLPALAAIQLFLIATVLTVMAVSFAVHEWERAQQESSLHQRFSDLLVTLTDTMIQAGVRNLDSATDKALRLIGEFALADHCVLMESDDNGRTVSVTHRWNAGGAGGRMTQTGRASLEQLPWISEQLRSKGYLILQQFDRVLPEEAAELESIRQTLPDTLSAIIVGLFADDRLIGAIGYGYAQRNVRWSSESIYLKYLAVQLFANILRRKRVEQELELSRDKLRSLANEMAVTEERARRRTAVDLHDGIGQNLAVARMKAGQLLKQLDGQPELVQLRNLIDDALRGTRHIIADLSPSILYELGLLPALQSLAERFSLANEITCDVAESGASWEVGNDLKITLYRGVQECLNNVARHAQAQNTSIRVIWQADMLNIEISDDGVGFANRESAELPPHAKGFGLFSLREGIMLLDGQVEIETAKGIGTTVRLCVPRHGAEKRP